MRLFGRGVNGPGGSGCGTLVSSSVVYLACVIYSSSRRRAEKNRRGLQVQPGSSSLEISVLSAVSRVCALGASVAHSAGSEIFMKLSLGAGRRDERHTAAKFL